MAAWEGTIAWPPGIDLRRTEQVQMTVASLLEQSPFERVLHLAAHSSVQTSSRDPLDVYQVNLMGTLHLLEALGRADWKGRFLFVSTSAVYGNPEKIEPPLRETSPLLSASPYAASKAGAEQAVLEWGNRSGSEVVVARPSNHSGPGQSDHYFLPSMARQITAVAAGEKVRVATGNLAPARDFLHVDDVVGAYLALFERGHSGTVYNVASGRAVPLSELLDGLIRASRRQVEVTVDRQRFRPEGGRPLEMSVERIHQHTGWSASLGLPRLYSDLIDYWETQR